MPFKQHEARQTTILKFSPILRYDNQNRYYYAECTSGTYSISYNIDKYRDWDTTADVDTCANGGPFTTGCSKIKIIEVPNTSDKNPPAGCNTRFDVGIDNGYVGWGSDSLSIRMYGTDYQTIINSGTLNLANIRNTVYRKIDVLAYDNGVGLLGYFKVSLTRTAGEITVTFVIDVEQVAEDDEDNLPYVDWEPSEDESGDPGDPDPGDPDPGDPDPGDPDPSDSSSSIVTPPDYPVYSVKPQIVFESDIYTHTAVVWE